MLRASDVVDVEMGPAEFEDRMVALDEILAGLSLLEFLEATQLPPPDLDLPDEKDT
jgi:hypothetical protein